MIYVLRHAVTLVLAAAAAWTLTRARWPHRAPGLAVLLWHATAISAVTGAVGLLLSLGLAPYGRGIAPALGELVTDLATGAASVTGAQVAAVVAGLLLAVAAVAAQAHSSWQLWRHRSRHHLLLRLVGRPDPHGRALVLDHPAAAAYYLPGPAGCVVVSTGALDALTDRELAAVLAHEHAHARGRHHLALAPFHALRRVLPVRPVLRAAEGVELLVEMCADDRAARHHGPATLAAALRRFHELGGHPAPTDAAGRAKTAGRFSADVDPAELAVQSWAIGHGLASLTVTGPLPREALAHAVPMLAALFVSAGDEPARCRQSVEHGWTFGGSRQ